MSRKALAGVFAVGLIAGVQIAAGTHTWTVGDVLPAVLSVGIALPAGGLGLGAIRKR